MVFSPRLEYSGIHFFGMALSTVRSVTLPKGSAHFREVLEKEGSCKAGQNQHCPDVTACTSGHVGVPWPKDAKGLIRNTRFNYESHTRHSHDKQSLLHILKLERRSAATCWKDIAFFFNGN